MLIKPKSNALSRPAFALALAGLLLLAVGPNSVATEGEELSSEAFLKRARDMLRLNAWGRLSGKIEHRDAERNVTEAGLELAILFTPELMKARFLLGNDSPYTVTQMTKLNEGRLPKPLLLEQPAPDATLTLEDFGVAPDDLTLSFLFWKYVRELENDEVRGRDCRVFKLSNPRDKMQSCKIWFSTHYFAPIQVQWFEGNSRDYKRQLAFLSFKKCGENMWYVKTLKIDGDDWKTRIRFERGVIELTHEEEPPSDLFGTVLTPLKNGE